MNSSISAHYVLSRTWRPQPPPFLQRNNKKWVIIIGHEQQFIIGSSRWLGKNENGGDANRARFVSSVLFNLTEQASTEPMYILNVN